MRRKCVFVGFAFPHHKGTHAGYNHISDYLHYDYLIGCEPFYLKCQKSNSSFISRAFRHISRKCFGYSAFPFHILRCIFLGITHDNLIFHFIYTENTYLIIKKFIRNGNRIVLTIHQPYEWFDNDLWWNRLRSADKVIILSNSEINQFSRKLGPNKVVFIPHGIDTNYYKPDFTVPKIPMILTVGNWLRDFEFGDIIYQKLKKYSDSIRISVVGLPANKQYITDWDRIDFLSGITDDELKLLYQRCSVLFLPLKRFTANNALLEAAATGCKILIATDATDNCYFPEKLICTIKPEVDKVISVIMNSIHIKQPNLQLSNYVSENYSWESVAHITKSIFDEL